MCTVTFLPRKRGYALAMNRDEKLSRMAGLPPAKKIVNGCTLLAPSEPGGGTWVGINQSGISFALINWYAITARVRSQLLSRGQVVMATGTASSPKIAANLLAQLPLKHINPFRLVGVFPSSQEIIQWQWDLKELVRKDHGWQAQQWISSGFDEREAQRVRGENFQQALKQKSTGTLDWLRRLHCSHSPDAGPFSTCMHRGDAATVSYTELVLSGQTGSVRYLGDAPCCATKAFCKRLRVIV